ncbi:MAG: hypothetical protein V7K97_01900 [Nostoc sp.]|uniref:hypothetical protein n=1 Tax=Nostoc sp. TaxID=1180 RepID=UPI002FF43F06
MGVSLIVFALSRVFWLSLLSLFAAGFGFILQIIAGRTLLQLLVSISNECKNTPALANGIRGYTDKTHLRGFQILLVRVGGLSLCSRDF